MLMRLGPVAFEVAPMNAHAIDYTGETSFAEKPVVGAEPPLEYVGEGANTWNIAGKLFPAKFGGESDLTRLHQLRASGQSQYLMRGDGRPMGWVVIKSIAERATYLDANGVGQIIEVTISVQRSRKPSNGSFFSVISGMFQ